MKKLIVIMMCVCLMSVMGCSDTKEIDGITYDTYGILNQGDEQNSNIEYDWVFGNVVWSVLTFYTIIGPIYFIGFDLFEPIGKKDVNKVKGAI